MLLEVSLTPALYPFRTIKKNHVTVAIDVLRATTAVCAAFQAGCSEVVPLDSLDDLVDYHHRGYSLAAERGGSKVDIALPDGGTVVAEYGNSPTEYLRHDLHGHRLAYSTTNGTVSILRGSDAQRTLVGAFANIDALTQQLLDEPQDLVILCSGWKNDFSVEDTLFAGALCQRLLDSGLYSSTHDAVAMAMTLWDACHDDPYGYCLEHASHVQRLIGFGAEEDIKFAFRQNTCPLVPQLENGTLHI